MIRKYELNANIMETKVDILKEHKSRNDRAAFNNALHDILPQLKHYAKNRLRIAKAKKKIRSGVYSVDDIVDEVFLIAYENLIDDIIDEKELKVRLFKAVDEVMERLTAKPEDGGDSINVENLIEQEMKVLQEDFTVEADGHLVMIEELDDISYHLDDDKPKIFILDSESEENIVKSLNLEEDLASDMDKRKALGKTYEELPDFSRDIFDLHTHARLTVEEIAEIKSIKADNVYRILEQVKFRIKSVL